MLGDLVELVQPLQWRRLHAKRLIQSNGALGESEMPRVFV